MPILTISLVLYKNESEKVLEAINSVLETPITVKLYIVDNSPTSKLSHIFEGINEAKYFYNNGDNVGFGKAHNLAISRLPKGDYHLVLNPDVFFDKNTILELIEYLEQNKSIGLIQPKICFPNGETQYLCKRKPTVLALFVRRFIPKNLQYLVRNYLDWYEMRDTEYNQIIDVPYLSGCFMLFRREYLDEIGYFDENIFMYLEDADITIRMAQKYRSVFYPQVQIYHYWERGAYKSWKLAMITIQSAIYYFNKYGWKFF